MARRVHNNFLMLLTQKEQREKRRIRPGEITEALGTTRATLLRWIRDDISKFEGPLVISICDYFGCEISDLLYIGEDEEN